MLLPAWRFLGLLPGWRLGDTTGPGEPLCSCRFVQDAVPYPCWKAIWANLGKRPQATLTINHRGPEDSWPYHDQLQPFQRQCELHILEAYMGSPAVGAASESGTRRVACPLYLRPRHTVYHPIALLAC